MTGFNHGMTGAVIALTVKNPVLAVPLSFISHFVQDYIPHFNYFAGEDGKNTLKGKFNVLLIADFCASLILMALLAIFFPAHKWLIWACMIAAASPDLIWGYHYLVRKKRRKDYGAVLKLIDSIENEFPGWNGVLGEVSWFILTTFILIKLR